LLIVDDAVPAAERLKNVAPGASPGYACRGTPSPGRGERLCAVSFAPTGLSSTPTRSQGLMAAPSLEAARDSAQPQERAQPSSNVAPKSHFDANRCSQRNICICNNRRRGGEADPSKWSISETRAKARGYVLGYTFQHTRSRGLSVNLANCERPPAALRPSPFARGTLHSPPLQRGRAAEGGRGRSHTPAR